MGVNTCEVGVVTEPECLGPCEPGTSVNLEGIVWHETEEGKYNLFLYISPCPLPHDVFMSTCEENWFCGIQRGMKCFFSALWICVGRKNCVCPLVHGCFYIADESGVSKSDSPLLSANMEGL